MIRNQPRPGQNVLRPTGRENVALGDVRQMAGGIKRLSQQAQLPSVAGNRERMAATQRALHRSLETLVSQTQGPSSGSHLMALAEVLRPLVYATADEPSLAPSLARHAYNGFLEHIQSVVDRGDAHRLEALTSRFADAQSSAQPHSGDGALRTLLHDVQSMWSQSLAPSARRALAQLQQQASQALQVLSGRGAGTPRAKQAGPAGMQAPAADPAQARRGTLPGVGGLRRHNAMRRVSGRDARAPRGQDADATPTQRDAGRTPRQQDAAHTPRPQDGGERTPRLSDPPAAPRRQQALRDSPADRPPPVPPRPQMRPTSEDISELLQGMGIDPAPRRQPPAAPRPVARPTGPGMQLRPGAAAPGAPAALRATQPGLAQGLPAARPTAVTRASSVDVARLVKAVVTKLPDSLRTPAVGNKVKAQSDRDYQHLFAAQPLASNGRPRLQKFSTLNFSSRGHRAAAILTDKMGNGSFGDFRWGISGDTLLAVKETRSVPKQAPKPGKHYTAPTPREEAIAEAGITQIFRDQIEAYNATFNAPSTDAAQTLMHTRRKTTPFQIHDLVEVPEKNKMFLVMTPEAGSLDHVQRQQMPEAARGRLALNLAAQGFTELVALHAAGAAHLDLKTANIFFNEDGQFKIMDFGLSRPIDARGRTDRDGSDGRKGSLFTPEMYAPVTARGRLGGFARLTPAVDVWAMAGSVLMMSSPEAWWQLFGAPRHERFSRSAGRWVEDVAANSQEATERLAAFNGWKDALPRRDDGTINVLRIRQGDGGFGAVFAPLARQNPQLCALLLQHACVTDPSKRMTAAQLAPLVRALVPTDAQDAAQNAALSVLSAVADRPKIDAIRRDANLYQAWADAHPAQLNNAPAPRVRGIVRNLPEPRAYPRGHRI